jgi:cobalt-zinc-cadmium efflux system membrane fusion protein
MNKMIALLAFSLLFIAACNRRSAEGNEGNESQGKQDGGVKKDSAVEMSLVAQEHIGLVVAPAVKTQLNEYLNVTGTVQPIDSQVGQVGPLARGRLIAVRARVGDRVIAGQTLATFDNVEAGELFTQERSAQAELARLKAQLIPATRQAERARHLADIGAGSEKDYEASRAEQQGMEQNVRSQQALIDGMRQRLLRFGVSDTQAQSGAITSLKAPFSGVVIKAQASPGDVVDAGRDLFIVADLSSVWVQAEVYEKDLGRIRTGQEALITVDTYPNETFTGRVAYISDVLDRQTRTAPVRCEVANHDMRLKTDMFAKVELPTRLSKQAIAVPSSALQQVEGKNVVFIRRSTTQFEKREVEKGVTVNGQTEIISGLQVGDAVVTQGAFHLKSILAGGELGED